MANQLNIFNHRVKDLDFRNHKVNALWWSQPYASAMLFGKVETRTWNTNYRGLVLICSTIIPFKKPIVESISGIKFSKQIDELVSLSETANMNGFAIAIGRLTDCYRMTPNDEQQTFVKYNPKLYCHVYDDVTPIEPFQLKGCQGWKTLTDEEKFKIKPIK